MTETYSDFIIPCKGTKKYADTDLVTVKYLKIGYSQTFAIRVYKEKATIFYACFVHILQEYAYLCMRYRQYIEHFLLSEHIQKTS